MSPAARRRTTKTHCHVQAVHFRTGGTVQTILLHDAVVGNVQRGVVKLISVAVDVFSRGIPPHYPAVIVERRSRFSNFSSSGPGRFVQFPAATVSCDQYTRIEIFGRNCVQRVSPPKSAPCMSKRVICASAYGSQVYQIFQVVRIGIRHRLVPQVRF
ncbi:hypothetical protein ALO59_200031 [Pseudomonas amygdali pv. mellea]|nr:hypothetical protein ALO59_200031 [Pseudomonas amygdali pv. mellea]